MIVEESLNWTCAQSWPALKARGFLAESYIRHLYVLTHLVLMNYAWGSYREGYVPWTSAQCERVTRVLVQVFLLLGQQRTSAHQNAHRELLWEIGVCLVLLPGEKSPAVRAVLQQQRAVVQHMAHKRAAWFTRAVKARAGVFHTGVPRGQSALHMQYHIHVLALLFTVLVDTSF